ncbi:hypothetical protein [Thermococcus sp. MAR1]|nr:hypothetical protein [Thermococcus sp. MAR1]
MEYDTKKVTRLMVEARNALDALYELAKYLRRFLTRIVGIIK